MTNSENIDAMVETWRSIILGDEKSWVLFENGTCVILMAPEEDLAAQAIELLKEWGPVVAGTSAGDFTVIELLNYPGYAITGHHPDILNYVSQEETGEEERNDVVIGMLGRQKRHDDAISLKVVHIEDKR